MPRESFGGRLTATNLNPFPRAATTRHNRCEYSSPRSRAAANSGDVVSPGARGIL